MGFSYSYFLNHSIISVPHSEFCWTQDTHTLNVMAIWNSFVRNKHKFWNAELWNLKVCSVFIWYLKLHVQHVARILICLAVISYTAVCSRCSRIFYWLLLCNQVRNIDQRWRCLADDEIFNSLTIVTRSTWEVKCRDWLWLTCHLWL